MLCIGCCQNDPKWEFQKMSLWEHMREKIYRVTDDDAEKGRSRETGKRTKTARLS